MRYLFFLFGFVLLGCSQGMSIKKSDNNIYYCVTFEGDGLYFFNRNRIKSQKELSDAKRILKNIYSGYDANYYKVIKKNNNILYIYGYSILTNKLKVLLITDKNKRLVYERFYDTHRKKYTTCKRRYKHKKGMLFSEIQCDNNTLQKNRYRYRDDLKYMVLDTVEYYVGNKLKNRILYNLDGTIKDQIIHNNKISKYWRSWIGSYDGCVPFKIYPLLPKAKLH